VLTAPISAVLMQRRVEVGTFIAPGTTGFVLADTTSVKAVFGAPDISIKNFKLGDPLSITTDAVPGTESSGHITRISPSADPASRVFEVEVTIPNPQNLLKPGMVVSLLVAEGGTTVEIPVVPLTAIVRSKDNPNNYAVMVIEDQGGQQIARLRNVTLGEALGNTIAVTSGVNVGEQIITTGATLVVDGEPVQVIP
jgi:multidrug efflux system membrane fusion protein